MGLFLVEGTLTFARAARIGLTPDQLVTVRRRSRFNGNNRRRGPSPSSYAVFFRSNRNCSEAALFLSICRVVGLARPTVSIDNGERLCEAYEIFRAWEPTSDLDFELAVLLLDGAAHGVSIDFGPCPSCAGSMLVDKFGDARASCHFCRRNQRDAA